MNFAAALCYAFIGFGFGLFIGYLWGQLAERRAKTTEAA